MHNPLCLMGIVTHMLFITQKPCFHGKSKHGFSTITLGYQLSLYERRVDGRHLKHLACTHQLHRRPSTTCTRSRFSMASKDPYYLVRDDIQASVRAMIACKRAHATTTCFTFSTSCVQTYAPYQAHTSALHTTVGQGTKHFCNMAGYEQKHSTGYQPDA